MLIGEIEMKRWKAVALMVPFVAQLLLPATIGTVDVRLVFTAGYLLAAVGLLLDPRRRAAIRGWPASIRESVAAPPATPAARVDPAPTPTIGV